MVEIKRYEARSTDTKRAAERSLDILVGSIPRRRDWLRIIQVGIGVVDRSQTLGKTFAGWRGGRRSRRPTCADEHGISDDVKLAVGGLNLAGSGISLAAYSGRDHVKLFQRSLEGEVLALPNRARFKNVA